jgi:hypothetical protein
MLSMTLCPLLIRSVAPGEETSYCLRYFLGYSRLRGISTCSSRAKQRAEYALLEFKTPFAPQQQGGDELLSLMPLVVTYLMQY